MKPNGFNLETKESDDKSGGLPWKETVYRNGLVSLMAELNLVDVYRTLYPNTKTYTYETKSQKLKSRIDYFIIAKQPGKENRNTILNCSRS